MTADTAVPRIQIRPDYSIPRVIIGAWQMAQGHSQAAINRDAIFSAFDRFVDLGLNTFDCADIYTGVENLLGEYLKRRRARYGESGIENIKIHTKLVPDLTTLTDITRSDVERIIDRSRKRLGVDRLNMVQFAWWDYAVKRYVEVASWLTEIQQRGHIQLIGATNFDSVRLAELFEAGIPIALHQVQYSVLDHRPSRDMTVFCAEHGLWLACYGTLGGGYISDRYLGTEAPTEPFENRSLRKYKLIVDEFGGWDVFQECLTELKSIAAKRGVSIASVATRFIMDRHCVAAVILGARSANHVSDILEMCRLHLDDEDQRRIKAIISAAPGPRGHTFELERDREGIHGKIMRYALNRP